MLTLICSQQPDTGAKRAPQHNKDTYAYPTHPDYTVILITGSVTVPSSLYASQRKGLGRTTFRSDLYDDLEGLREDGVIIVTS